MSLKFNVRHLEKRDLTFEGELPIAELDLEKLDELIHVHEPLAYNLQVEKLSEGILVTGSLRLALECECARCLKAFPHEICINNWTSLLPFEGEEKVEVVNDCVDLVPIVREDIVLAFPQNPLCDPDCKGLKSLQKDLASGGLEKTEASPAWAELNKLKF
jgi:uncharacterized metal-binding protein YceD (DUF177 family)